MLPTIALGVGLMVGAMPGATQTGVSLVISGDPGASFHGRCTTSGPAGTETFDLIGEVPFRRDFPVSSLSCQIAARGGIMVEVYKGGGRMFWTVRNGTVSVAVS